MGFQKESPQSFVSAKEVDEEVAKVQQVKQAIA